MKAHDALLILETTHNSRNGNWGFMVLLNMKNVEIMDMLKLNSRKEQSIANYSEDCSHEIPEVNEVDINQSKKKKTV